MKTKHNTGITKLALCASMIALLAACSHQPSESDAKAVIKQRLGDCKYFSLDSFEKTNGISVDENDYRVEVKYAVKMSLSSKYTDRLKTHLDAIVASKKYWDAETAATTAYYARKEDYIGAKWKEDEAEADKFHAANPDAPRVALDLVALAHQYDDEHKGEPGHRDPTPEQTAIETTPIVAIYPSPRRASPANARISKGAY